MSVTIPKKVINQYFFVLITRQGLRSSGLDILECGHSNFRLWKD